MESPKETQYRAVVARANILALDRPELQCCSKDVWRWLSRLMQLALKALKRLGIFVAGHLRFAFHYPWQEVEKIDIYSDTDWSGFQKN